MYKKYNNIICMFAKFLKVRSHFLKLKIIRLDNFLYIILYSSQNSTKSAYSFSFLEASTTFSNIKNVAFIFFNSKVMQLNLNFLSKKSKKVYFFKDIFGKFKPGFVAQRKWWNGGNPPYGKLIKVGTGLQHLK